MTWSSGLTLLLIPADKWPNAVDTRSDKRFSAATIKFYRRKISRHKNPELLPSGLSDSNGIQQSFGEEIHRRRSAGTNFSADCSLVCPESKAAMRPSALGGSLYLDWYILLLLSPLISLFLSRGVDNTRPNTTRSETFSGGLLRGSKFLAGSRLKKAKYNTEFSFIMLFTCNVRFLRHEELIEGGLR